MTKNYRIKTSCPQCGCSGVSNLSEEQIKKRYGDLPNVELECHECMAVLEMDVEQENSEQEYR